MRQALADGRDNPDSVYPTVDATPEAFFRRCRALRPAFFAEGFRPFTAAVLGAVRDHFAALVVLDGSRLAAIARRLKLLWDERAVVLPGCLLAVYELSCGLPDGDLRGRCRRQRVDAGPPRPALDEKVRQEDGLGVHAGMGETSTLLFLRPDLVSPAHAQAAAQSGRDWNDLVRIARGPDWPGYFGSPRRASAAHGARGFTALSARFIEFALKMLDGGDLKQVPRYSDAVTRSPPNVAHRQRRAGA